MSEASLGFVQKMFLTYYEEHMDEVDFPDHFDEREFAALLLKEKVMVRHKMFKSRNDLQNFLCSIIPSDVYYSSARYEQPDAPEMGLKGWIGADLVFDIDADHIPTQCDKVHDNWTCMVCGFRGKGMTPEKCPVCGGEKLDESTWPCEVCLASAKNETIRLLDMLTNDFAFSEKALRVYFSGHRGYHVHVLDKAIESLDAMARKEIVDYVCGLGFNEVLHGLDEKGLVTLKLRDTGWRGRVARGMYEFVQKANPEDYTAIGTQSIAMKALTKNRQRILKCLESSETWSSIKGVGPETWKRIFGYSLKSKVTNVDTVVTTDIHRLIRLAGTLNGKTGLKKVEFSISEIGDFDPFRSAIAFREGDTTVFVHDSPKFRIGDEIFGPYKSQRVTLPNAAAALLVCKKRAEVVD